MPRSRPCAAAGVFLCPKSGRGRAGGRPRTLTRARCCKPLCVALRAVRGRSWRGDPTSIGAAQRPYASVRGEKAPLADATPWAVRSQADATRKPPAWLCGPHRGCFAGNTPPGCGHSSWPPARNRRTVGSLCRRAFGGTKQMSDITRPTGGSSSYVPPPARVPATHDGLAVASLVLSLVWLWGLGSLLAVIFGHLSRRDARRAGRQPSGLATAGMIIGWVGLALAVVLTIVMIVAAVQASDHNACVQNAINSGMDPTMVCP